MSRSSINQQKAIYPGGTIVISPTGNDANSGFDGDIASWDRAQEILNSYDFDNGFVNIQTEIDAPFELNGFSATGIYGLSVNFTLDQTNNCTFRSFTLVSISSTVFDGCQLDFELVDIVILGGITYRNNSGGSAFSFVRSLDMNSIVLENMNSSSPIFRINDCNYIDARIATITNCDGCRFFEVTTGRCDILFSTTVPQTVGGNARLVNLAEGIGIAGSPTTASSINYEEIEPILHKFFPSNTITSGYGPDTVINGTNLRGDYANNAAAAAAGVKFGHFYYNTTIGAVSKRV